MGVMNRFLNYLGLQEEEEIEQERDYDRNAAQQEQEH